MTGKIKIFRSFGGVLFLSFFAYIFAYFSRLNINATIPAMQASLSLTDMQIGIITSSFFWVYAFGQLINGFLGDRLQPHLMISTGLIGTAICNFLFQIQTQLLPLAIIWALNGYFQSMLWGPILRSLTNWSEPKQMVTASFTMSVSCIIGQAFATSFTSFLSARADWRLCFIIPAIAALIYGIFIMVSFKGKPDESDFVYDSTALKESDTKKQEAQKTPFLKFVLLANIPILIIIAVMQGIIKGGFSVWFPKILSDTGLIPDNSIWIILLLLPVVNFIAVGITNFVKKKYGTDNYPILFTLYTVASVVSLLLVLISGSTLTFTLLMLIFSIIVNAIGPVLTSYIPFTFAKYKWVSLGAGMIDFAIYLGSALQSLVVGAISGEGMAKWQNVAVFWLISTAAATVCAVFLLISYKMHKKKADETVVQQ